MGEFVSSYVVLSCAVDTDIEADMKSIACCISKNIQCTVLQFHNLPISFFSIPNRHLPSLALLFSPPSILQRKVNPNVAAMLITTAAHPDLITALFVIPIVKSHARCLRPLTE